ncbi:iron-sulfur cluster assembly scaffold protein [Patescibacteria group bacterium]|nr:iron-sulfur cluster assembly scaffold protein [Patescibacteria group bacterium]
MYREIILDHYKNPRNFGELKKPDKKAGKSNAVCGDHIDIALKLDKRGKIVDIKFSGAGCSVSRAGGSILTEIVKGRTVNTIKKYTDKQFMADMDVPITPARKRCALLALETLRQALDIPKKK